MNFSVTGHLLTPDITTIVYEYPKSSANECFRVSHGNIKLETTTSTLNEMGYAPLIGTFSGCARTLLGIVHTIGHLALTIFSKYRKRHLQETTLGLINIGRGIVEMIPALGNYLMVKIDMRRKELYHKKSLELLQKAMGPQIDAFMFAYGKEVARRPKAEFVAEMDTLGNDFTTYDVMKIIQNKA